MASILVQKNFGPLARASWKFCPKFARAKILNIVLAKTGPKSVQKRSKIENRRDKPKLKFNGEYFGPKKFRPPCPGKLEILPKVCPGENFEYRSGENGPQKCPKRFENRKSPRHAKIKI